MFEIYRVHLIMRQIPYIRSHMWTPIHVIMDNNIYINICWEHIYIYIYDIGINCSTCYVTYKRLHIIHGNHICIYILMTYIYINFLCSLSFVWLFVGWNGNRIIRFWFPFALLPTIIWLGEKAVFTVYISRLWMSKRLRYISF